MSTIGYLIIAAALVVEIVATIRCGMWRLTVADVIAMALVTAGDVLLAQWAWAALGATVLAYVMWVYWRRRKRRRGPRTIGARARARIAAMTARMRERPSRPVLRPVPGVSA